MLIYLKLLLMAVFWGGTFLAGRAVAGEASPFCAAFLRFFFASVCLIFFLSSRQSLPRITGTQFLQIMVLGLTGIFAFNFFFFAGLAEIQASRAAMIMALNPALIALFSAWLFKERLGLLKCVGIVLCVSGALVVISRGRPWELITSGLGLGEIYMLAACASWVTYSLLGKATMRVLDPLTVVTYACLVGTAGLLVPAIWTGVLFDQVLSYGWITWAWLLFAGVPGAALAYIWFYEGIRKIGPSSTGAFISLVPVSAVVLSISIVGEPLEGSVVLGASTVTLGLLLTSK